MKTWLLWTHYDCEVYASLHPTEEAAYHELRTGWLDDCNVDDCGHELNELSAKVEIVEALDYHWDELDYLVAEVDVPQPTTAEQTMNNAQQLTAEWVERPTEQNAMPLARAEDLLSSLQSFTESS